MNIEHCWTLIGSELSTSFGRVSRHFLGFSDAQAKAPQERIVVTRSLMEKTKI